MKTEESHLTDLPAAPSHLTDLAATGSGPDPATSDHVHERTFACAIAGRPVVRRPANDRTLLRFGRRRFRLRCEVCACRFRGVVRDRPGSVFLLGGASEVGAKERAQTLRVAVQLCCELLRCNDVRHMDTPFRVRRHGYMVHRTFAYVNGQSNVCERGNERTNVCTRDNVRTFDNTVAQRDNVRKRDNVVDGGAEGGMGDLEKVWKKPPRPYTLQLHKRLHPTLLAE